MLKFKEWLLNEFGFGKNISGSRYPRDYRAYEFLPRLPKAQGFDARNIVPTHNIPGAIAGGIGKNYLDQLYGQTGQGMPDRSGIIDFKNSHEDNDSIEITGTLPLEGTKKATINKILQHISEEMKDYFEKIGVDTRFAEITKEFFNGKELTIVVKYPKGNSYNIIRRRRDQENRQ